jgi:hypothetical protein
VSAFPNGRWTANPVSISGRSDTPANSAPQGCTSPAALPQPKAAPQSDSPLLSPAPTNQNSGSIITGSDESAGAGGSFASGSTKIDLPGSLPGNPCEIQGARSNLSPCGTALEPTQFWRTGDRCAAGVFFTDGKSSRPDLLRDAVRVSNVGEPITEDKAASMSGLSHQRQIAELFRNGFWTARMLAVSGGGEI